MAVARRLHLPPAKTFTPYIPARGASRRERESVRAPMPAQVRDVQVQAGDTVEKGQTLLLLEAMKMEIRIKAPIAGQLSAPAGATRRETVEKTSSWQKCSRRENDREIL